MPSYPYDADPFERHVRAQAIFVTRTGREVVVRVIRSGNKLWVEQKSGQLVEFLDELYDPADGQMTFVEVRPDDREMQPRSNRTIRHVTQIGL